MPTARSPALAVTPRSLRHAAIDLAALILALFVVLTNATGWAFYTMAGYTGLMLVMKMGAFVAKVKPVRADDAPPDVVFHVIYGAMVLFFLVGQWWGLAAAWAAIWGLSFLAARR